MPSDPPTFPQGVLHCHDFTSVGANCPSLTFTGGRLSKRIDGSGTTYISYDAEGRVTKEVRDLGIGQCTNSNGVAEPSNYKDIHYSPHHARPDSGRVKS